MKLPFRRRDHTCLTRFTYRYFVEPERAAEIWHQLEAELGPIQRLDSVRVQQISAHSVTVRASFEGNPITVMQRAGVDPQLLTRLHQIFGFADEPPPE